MLAIRKSSHGLFHRANARELAKPQVLPAPLRTKGTTVKKEYIQNGNEMCRR